MNDLQKFQADINRIIKHDRADNNGVYDGVRASRRIAELFVSCNRDCESLAGSISEKWLSMVTSSSEEQPSKANLDWLFDVQEFLDGTLSGETVLSYDDFVELRDMISYEAEDLPVDMLTTMMSTIMEHNAL